MTIIDELERAQFSLRECVQLLQSINRNHPSAAAPLLEMSQSENTEPVTRLLLKVLLATGSFAAQQEQLESAVIAMAEAPRDTGLLN